MASTAYEGVSAEALRKCMQKALTNVTESVGADEFVGCFGGIGQVPENNELLRTLHQQLTESLAANVEVRAPPAPGGWQQRPPRRHAAADRAPFAPRSKSSTTS